MGTYLSHPLKEKMSETADSEILAYGASSMQGWRLNQEDAHNCILNLDEGASMFAVYDGHGGAEVSQYAAKSLANFILSSPDWRSGDIGRSLIEAFLSFDETLTKSDVVLELRRIRRELKALEANSEDLDNENCDEDATFVPFEKQLEKLGIRFRYDPHEGFNDDDVFVVRKASTEQCTKLDDSPDHVDVPLTPPSSPAGGGLHSSSIDHKPFASFGDEMPSSPQSSSSSCNVMDADDGQLSAIASSFNETTPSSEVTSSFCSTTSVVKSGGDDVESKTPVDVSAEMAFECVARLNENKTKVCSTMEISTTNVAECGDESKKCSMEVETSCVDNKANEVEMETEFDHDLLASQQVGDLPGSDSGTTACVLIIKDNKLYVANIGDSRCVLCRAGNAVDLSVDHKPEDELERLRIEKAGGKVTPDGRVNGGLNLSRAFGDHSYKRAIELTPAEQMISAFPDVRVESLTSDDKFLILACDGIWNSMTSQELVDFVSLRLSKGTSLVNICEEVCDACLATTTIGDGTGCDNMTIIIVLFKMLLG